MVFFFVKKKEEKKLNKTKTAFHEDITFSPRIYLFIKFMYVVVFVSFENNVVIGMCFE